MMLGKRTVVRGALFLWMWVVALLPWARAQEEPLLEEVVVTATRTEVPVSELGVSATVITEEEIRRRQATDVVELLRDVAGFTMIQTGSRGALAQLYPRGGESNFTLVLIDGVQVNEAGGGFDFSSLTTDNIERIEIIRGPQSALYGSDAIGGVIHIITKRGMGRPTARLSTAHGAHSENGAYVGEQKISISGGTELLGYSLAFGRTDDQGILETNNDFFNNTFSGRVDIYPREDLDLTLTARVHNSHFEFPTEHGGDRPDRIFPGLDPDQYQDRLEAVASAQARFDLFPWWEHVVLFGVHWLDQDYRDPPNPTETAFDAPPGSKTDSLETRTTLDYHMNLRWEGLGFLRSVTTLGFEWDREALDMENTSTIRFGPLPWAFTASSATDVDRTNRAYYFQEQVTLFDRLHLTGGFRVEDNSAFGTDVNPRGSVALEIRETGTKLRAAVGTGIKEPTFLENFGGFGTVGNPDLKPERSFSWEVGVDQSIMGDRIQLGITYFENVFEDLIAFVPTPSPPPPVLPPNWFNIQEAESRGVEFMVRVKPGFGLTLGGNYTFVDTEVIDDGGLGNLFFAKGKELLRRPNHSASFFVDWLWGGLNLHLNGTYVGDRDDTFFTVAPGLFGFYTFVSQRMENEGYFLLDLAASYTVDMPERCALKAIRIFAKARNLLDEDYEEVLGYTSPGMSAMAGVEFRF